MILELLANDSTVLLPLIIETQLDSVLSNCTRLVGDISQCIQQHQGSRLQKGLRWVAIGRGDMANLRSTLEAHKTTLNLLLEKVNQTKLQEVDCTTLEIKTRTEALFQHTKAIKTDTSRILEVVESLARLYANTLMSVAQTPPACMLERYLDESTTYAKSGIGESTTEITAEDHKVSNSFRPRPCGGPDAMQCHEDDIISSVDRHKHPSTRVKTNKFPTPGPCDIKTKASQAATERENNQAESDTRPRDQWREGVEV
ncbi:hypothetical protein AUP68_01369 [Ilyonectria robusta]